MSTKKHVVGRSKRKRRSPARLHAADRALSAAKQAIWEAYHAGKLTSAQMNERTNAIERKRSAVRKEKQIPYFRAGQSVRHVRGDVARVEGVVPSDWGGPPQYRVVRGHERGEEIHDIWPEEVMSRAGK